VRPVYPPDEFTAGEYLERAAPLGIGRAVLVQVSFYGRDHRCLIDAVDRHPGRFAPVGLLSGPDLPADLERLAALGFRAFRVSAGDLGAPECAGLWRRAAEVRSILCPLLDPVALPAVDKLCAACPETRVVVDHLARIGIDGEIRDSDVRQLCAMAKRPGVYVKASAFYALGRRRPPYADLAPLIERVFDAFGPRRLIWGTDAPFQLAPPHDLAGSLELIRDGLPFLSGADREWMLRSAAASVFFGEER
jgi:predicted TIM-barrel fold metal-dependent hydrolase